MIVKYKIYALIMTQFNSKIKDLIIQLSYLPQKITLELLRVISKIIFKKEIVS
jgi:hypothetical protein